MDFDLRHAQLFLDDATIEQTVRLKRVVHQPHKYYGNPVYTVGAPWEGAGVIYLAGVYVDPADSLWKAWYVTLQPEAYPEIVFAVCMVVSEDGLEWRRPELDVYKGHNGEKTNIVLDLGPAGRTAGPTIMYEPENDPEPWTMFLSLAWPADSMEYKGYFLRSTDGVHWRWLQERPNGFAHGFHDRTTAMTWSGSKEHPYVIIGRGKEDICRWDLTRTAHRIGLNSDGEIDVDGKIGRAEDGDVEPTRVVVPDLEDDNSGEIYHAHAFEYEGISVGLFQWYWETNDPYGEMELITSRDTVEWNRVNPRQAFLPRSPGGGALGAFDCQITDTALSPPIRTSRGAMPNPWGGIDTLWFYYWGGPAMHGNRHLTFGRGIGMAQLRADGFCSLRAERFAGTLVTKPFEWPGGTLLVNAACLGGGATDRMVAEVLDENLTPIPGLTKDDADRLANDSTALQQTWNGDPSGIEALAGRRIRLKFYMENYDLFSFRSTLRA